MKTVVLTLNWETISARGHEPPSVLSRAGAVRRLTLRQAPIASREQERGTTSSRARHDARRERRHGTAMRPAVDRNLRAAPEVRAEPSTSARGERYATPHIPSRRRRSWHPAIDAAAPLSTWIHVSMPGCNGSAGRWQIPPPLFRSVCVQSRVSEAGSAIRLVPTRRLISFQPEVRCLTPPRPENG